MSGRQQSGSKWPLIFKTLGHPLRLEIVRQLATEEKCVCDLWTSLRRQQSVVSQHLAVLRKRGIVECRRKGTTVSYFLKNQEVGEVLKVIEGH